MKKRYIRDLLMVFIGIIICGIGIVLAESIQSSEVLYDNSNSNTSNDNVQDVIDNLYDLYNHSGLGFTLLTRSPSGISTVLEGGLYRYQGVQDESHNVDNYICFGTTNKSDCVSDADKYMYRIIGINEVGQLKLIKKEALNTAYKWNSSSGVEWPNSDLYIGLNGSYFLTNTTYVPDSTWSDRIVNTIWYNGDIADASMSALEMYNLESNLSNTINAKIGLMYMYDYDYGLPGGTNCGSMSNQMDCRTSWIHLANNDDSPPVSSYEWTITRLSNYYAWSMVNDGYLNKSELTSYRSVRPVFFLRASEIIASGNGTITDPYVLS